MSLWIFCADIMPKPGQDVLVVTEHGHEFVGALTIDSREGKTFQDEVTHTVLPLPKVVEDYCFKDMSGEKVSAVTSPAQQIVPMESDPVIAWMPLPAPPVLPKAVIEKRDQDIEKKGE